jgi:hypothetical protein
MGRNPSTCIKNAGSLINAATTGVERKKSTSPLFNVPLGVFADEIAWVKQFLAERGYHVEEAVLDPYVER